MSQSIGSRPLSFRRRTLSKLSRDQMNGTLVVLKIGVQTLAYQRVLYLGLKGSHVTSSFPVVGPSLTSYHAYVREFRQGAFSQVADVGNIHDYFGKANPGTIGTGGAFPPYGYYGSIPFWKGIASYIYAPHPIESTETGWDDGATYGRTSGLTVSAAVKARYTMRVLLEHWNAGIART